MLEQGEKAPDFSAKDQQGNTVSLSDYKGKRIVLYFYPKDNTPGCTKEACNLRDNYEELISQGFVVLGVSLTQKHRIKNLQKSSLYLFPCWLIPN